MKHLFIFILILTCKNEFNAQPFTLQEDIKPIELKLINYNPKNSVGKGKISVNEVTQKKDTTYFFVKSLSIYSPIYFEIIPKANTNRLSVSLHKETWAQVEENMALNSAGYGKTSFITNSEFGIRVISKKKPIDYVILVWVGDEVPLDPPLPFKKYNAKK